MFLGHGYGYESITAELLKKCVLRQLDTQYPTFECFPEFAFLVAQTCSYVKSLPRRHRKLYY